MHRVSNLFHADKRPIKTKRSLVISITAGVRKKDCTGCLVAEQRSNTIRNASTEVRLPKNCFLAHEEKIADPVIELDINLFDESELYDINIIGSLFKAWLRDLPSEILPKATQARVAAAHPDAVEVPQMLRDELSNLPPWNYYLLFAITCHLSLLHACHDKNKMSYSNLCICFQPCIGIDAYCFHFLVCEWRSCWQGCHTEKLYLEQEYQAIEGLDRPESSLPESEGVDSNIVVRINDAPQPPQGNNRPNLFGRGRDKNASPASRSRARPSTERSNYPSNPPGHNRNEAQLPEIQPMKPMTWDVTSNHPQGNRPASQSR